MAARAKGERATSIGIAPSPLDGDYTVACAPVTLGLRMTVVGSALRFT
jgi:hypothetical protein